MESQQWELIKTLDLSLYPKIPTDAELYQILFTWLHPYMKLTPLQRQLVVNELNKNTDRSELLATQEFNASILRSIRRFM